MKHIAIITYKNNLNNDVYCTLGPFEKKQEAKESVQFYATRLNASNNLVTELYLRDEEWKSGISLSKSEIDVFISKNDNVKKMNQDLVEKRRILEQGRKDNNSIFSKLPVELVDKIVIHSKDEKISEKDADTIVRNNRVIKKKK